MKAELYLINGKTTIVGYCVITLACLKYIQSLRYVLLLSCLGLKFNGGGVQRPSIYDIVTLNTCMLGANLVKIGPEFDHFT